MCFNIDRKNKKVKVAKKDIICYKFLHKNIFGKEKGIFYSPYQHYVYNFNHKTIFKVKKFYIDIFDKVYDGLHSFSREAEALESIESSRRRISSREYDLFQCIIPKGTKYYYNSNDNEYVSLTLEFKERLTFNAGKIN